MLLDDLKTEMKEAMKAKESEKLQTIRGVLAAVQAKQIDTPEQMTDEDIVKVIATMSKQLKDAKKDFETGGREDLVESTNNELKILEKFLPKQLDDEKITEIAKSVIEKVGTENFGMLMGSVMKEVAGQADGNRVREIVQKLV
jgi:uncharacterized protein